MISLTFKFVFLILFLSSYNNNQTFSFFRRIDTNITLIPLYCTKFNIVGLCSYQNGSVFIDFHLFDFVIYVSSTFIISDLEFNGYNASLVNTNGSFSFLTGISVNFSTRYLYTGLFTIEAIIDNIDPQNRPNLVFENVKVLNFLAFQDTYFKFVSFVKLCSFGGSLLISNTEFNNTFFINGIVYNDIDIQNHDPIYNFDQYINYYSSFTSIISGNISVIRFENSSIESFNINQFNDSNLATTINLFYLNSFKGSFALKLVFFQNIFGSSYYVNSIFNFIHCNQNILILGVQINNLNNFSILNIDRSSVLLSNVSVTNSQNSYSLMVATFSILSLNNSYFYGIFNQKADNNVPVFAINYGSFFINQTFMSNIAGMSIVIKNSKMFIFHSFFLKMIMGGYHLHFVNTSTTLQNSTFYDILGSQNFFLIESSQNFMGDSTNILNLKARSAFLCTSLTTFTFTNGLLSNFTEIDWAWSYNTVITNFWFYNMNFTNMTFNQGFLFFFNQVDMKFESCRFEYLRGIMGALVVAFNIYGGDLSTYDCLFNHIVGGNHSTSIIILEDSSTVFKKTKFYNVGWETPFMIKVNGFIEFDSVNMLWYWGCYLAMIIDCEFINDGPFSVFSGQIIFQINLGPIVFNNNKIIAKNQVDGYFYTGIIATDSEDVFFSNNTIEGLRCPEIDVYIFSHMNGPIGFFVTPTYNRVKSTVQFYAENNTFSNCSCETAGSLAVVNFNSVIMRNISFSNSKANSGGSFILSGLGFVIIYDVKITNSFGNNSGLFWIKNSDIISLVNCEIENALTMKGPSISLTNIVTFLIQNASVGFLQAENNGGFLQISSGHTFLQNVKFYSISNKNIGGIIFLSNYASLSLFDIDAKNIIKIIEIVHKYKYYNIFYKNNRQN